MTTEREKKQKEMGQRKRRRGAVGSVSKKVKGPAAAAPSGPQRVVLALSTRNRRKFITTVTGLENFPEVKLKNAAKLFGRTFSCGSSVSDTPAGGKEIVIQGDCMGELPDLLWREYQIGADKVFILDKGKEVPIG